MKVQVVASFKDEMLFTVKISQGVQSFRLDYTASDQECRWMAKMFRRALKHHDEAKRG